MQVRCCGQPRQERRIFHGIPRPVPTPTQNLVRPPHSRDDCGGEKRPRREHPAAREPRPVVRPRLAGEDCAHRKRERHRHSHVAEVQQGWVHRHQDVVLEQRIGPRSVSWHRPHRLEGIGRTHEQDGEEQDDAEQRRRRERQQLPRSVPVNPGHRGSVECKHPGPEENGAFQRPPQRDDGEQQRCGTASDGRDIGDGKVVRHQRHDHRDRGDGHQDKVCVNGAVAKLNPVAASDTHPDERDEHPEDCRRKGNLERTVRDKTDH